MDLRNKLTFGQVVAGLVLLGSLAIVAAWLARSWSPYADAFANLLGHAICGILGSVAALLARRRALLVLIAAGTATLGLYASLAWRNTIDVVTPRKAGYLEIVSLNTWHQLEDLDRLQAYLERADADIVLVYEFGPNKLALIERPKRTYPFAAGCAETWHCAVEILSKHAFATAEAGRRELFDGPPRVVATFGEGTSRLTIVGAHVMRPIDGPNGHLEEIRRIAGIAKAATGPVIVAGDFNATWWSSSFRIFSEESGLTHMGRFLPSWPAEARGIPQLNIDHLWVSKDLTIEDVHLGPYMGSDHRPLIASIRMPTGFSW